MSAASPEDPTTASTPASPTASGPNIVAVAGQRLAALRQDLPDAVVQIDAVRVDDTVIAIKATIALPGGARHSHIAATDVDSTASQSAQIADVQALATIAALDGLGVAFVRQPAPSDSQARPTAPARKAPVHQAPRKADAGADEGDHLPEYSWNAFWQAANARGLQREQVERALGRSVRDATPREAVEALQSAGLWDESR